jgi:Flp pilus assembly CpaE family ATPase
MTVINRMDRRSEIGQQDIERAVGGRIAHQVPSDYRRALHAMNQGRPLALDNHNDLAASFKALAQELAGVKPEKPTTEKSSGILGLFPGRKN